MISIDLMKICLRALSQVMEPLYLTTGYTIVLMVYAQASWFTKPDNYPNFVDVGKFLMADNNLSDGLIHNGVVCSPANLNVSQQNFNLVLFSTTPVSAHEISVIERYPYT